MHERLKPHTKHPTIEGIEKMVTEAVIVSHRVSS
jgi:hypothetical protein